MQQHSRRKVLEIVLTLTIVALLAAMVLAENNPGHDTLYVEQEGNSQLNGTFNITQNISIQGGRTTLSSLNLYGDGTTPTPGNPNIAAASNQLYLDAQGNVYVKFLTGGDTVFIGPAGTATDLNISGALYVQGNAAIQGTTLTVNGQNVCLADGTNCPAIAGSSSAGGWTNTTTYTTTKGLNINITNSTGGSTFSITAASGYTTINPNNNNASLTIGPLISIASNSQGYTGITLTGDGSPGYAGIHLKGGSGVTGDGIYFYSSQGAVSHDWAFTRSHADETIRTTYNGATILSTTTTGRAGINTPAPTSTLQVNGTTNTTYLIIANATAGSCDLKADTTGNVYCGTDANSGGSADGTGGWSNTSTYTTTTRTVNLTNSTGGTLLYVNTTTGRVSIGTNYADNKLTVYTSDDYGGITVNGSQDTGAGYALTNNNGYSYYLGINGATDDNNLRLYDITSDYNILAFDETGDNLGIGTDNTPSYTLEIHDATDTPTLVLTDDDVTVPFTSETTTDTFFFLSSLSTTAGGTILVGQTDSDAEALVILGGIGVTNPSDTTPAIKIIADKSDGSDGVADMGSLETVLQIANNDNYPAITILGNDNTGIRTNQPTSTLQVNGTTNTTNLIIANATAGSCDLKAGTNGQVYCGTDTNSADGTGGWTNTTAYTRTGLVVNVTNSTGASVLFVNTSNGRVGIGTATPSNKLEINDSSAWNGITIAGGTASTGTSLNLINNIGNQWSINIGGSTNPAAGGLLFYHDSSSKYSMIIDSSDRVGIATNTPTSTLQVNGTTNTTYLTIANNTASNCDLKADTAGNVYCGTDATGSGGGNISSQGNTGYIAQYQNNTLVNNSAIYQNGSNIGIGTTTPTARLEVIGDIVSRGTNWTPTVPADSVTLTGVAYGNGQFVAISSSGTNRIQTSQDGIVWKNRTAAAALAWQAITYGNGLFAAVSNNGFGQIMTSPNGIVWTQITEPYTISWKTITYGNGTFVAISNTGSDINSVMTSYNATTWTGRSAANIAVWNSVTYGNGQFVAVGSGGSYRVMTSPDGINWTNQTAAEANTWNSVAYGNGVFVAVSSDGTNRVMTSPDGITWTARSAAEANQWNAVTYGEGIFLAVSGDGTNRVMTSPDGITWTARPGAVGTWRSVAYGNGVFVAVSSAGTYQTMYSGKRYDSVTPNNNIYQGGMGIYGNVGIGTASSTTPLQVLGRANVTTLTITNTTAGSCDLKADTNGNVYCGTDNTGSASDGTGGWTNTTTYTTTTLHVNITNTTGDSILYVNTTGEGSVKVGTNSLAAKLSVNGTSGSELVTNGEFTGSASGWTVGTGWNYGSNQITHSAGNATNLSQNLNITAFSQHQITFDQSGGTQGEIGIWVGGRFIDCFGWDDIGRHTRIEFAFTTAGIVFDPTCNGDDTAGLFDGTIDNVTVNLIRYQFMASNDAQNGFTVDSVGQLMARTSNTKILRLDSSSTDELSTIYSRNFVDVWKLTMNDLDNNFYIASSALDSRVLTLSNSTGDAVFEYNVGIGGDLDVPDASLHIRTGSGDMHLQDTDSSSDIIFTIGTADSNHAARISAHDEGAYTGSLRFYTKESLGIGQLGDGDEQMRINPEGLVGIGTTDPQDLLHVSGDGYYNITLGSDDFSYDGGDDHWFWFSNMGGSSGLTSFVDTTGLPILNINNSGNVGIGTLVPTSTLQVNGTINATNILITNLTAGSCDLKATPSGSVYCGTDATGSGGGGNITGGSGVANYVAKWTNAGNITAGSIYDDGQNISIGTGAVSLNFSNRSNVLFIGTDAAYTGFGFTKPVNITYLTIASATAGSCDLKAYANGTIYCGTDATGSASDGTGGWLNTSTYTTSSLIINMTGRVVANNLTISGSNECIYLSGGGKLCGNSTCSTLYSPNGNTKIEACN